MFESCRVHHKIKSGVQSLKSQIQDGVSITDLAASASFETLDFLLWRGLDRFAGVQELEAAVAQLFV